MEEHQKLMKDKVGDIDAKVTEIYNAVVGNKSMGSVGMAERMNDMETTIDKLEIEIKSLEKTRIEDGVYMKIIRWLVAIVTVMVISFIIKEYILVK